MAAVYGTQSRALKGGLSVEDRYSRATRPGGFASNTL